MGHRGLRKGIQGHLQLWIYSKFKTSLDYMRPCPERERESREHEPERARMSERVEEPMG